MSQDPEATIHLLPLGTVVRVPRGTGLQDVLFAHGVEFPCGGRGRCKGCKIRLLQGSLPVTPEQRSKLSQAELDQGWRLSCRCAADADLKIELAQWETSILTDETVFEFEPRPGVGIAIDLGTTTIVAQALDLRTGQVLGVRTALNAQAQHGADIMSRIEFAVASHGEAELQRIVRSQIGGLVAELLGALPADAEPLARVVIVGNTVMHHLFCGVSLEPLSHYPFEPISPGLHRFNPTQLDWNFGAAGRKVRPDAVEVLFLPCLGGFVGSDILAGVLATKLHEAEHLTALIDLGTNGEIVVGNRDRMLCASTAAGPAFEGARISMGMRAATGAISEVHLEDGALRCHVLGNGAARGICGSGLVDAIATGLNTGLVKPTGRFARGETLQLQDPVVLNQWDVRELQLAKGAIAAGFRILLEQWGAAISDVRQLYLAGAFGNYINYSSARRIGLLTTPSEKVVPAGNTALLGAKMALFSRMEASLQYPELLSRMRHVSLNEDPRFQDVFVEEMSFPEHPAEG